MGRHSRRGPGRDTTDNTRTTGASPAQGGGPGTGRRRRAQPGEETPADGTPAMPYDTPAHGVPQARGGHPQQREDGGGWGEVGGTGAVPRVDAAYAAPGAPAGASTLPRPRGQGPRQDYVAAFPEGGRDRSAAGRFGFRRTAAAPRSVRHRLGRRGTPAGGRRVLRR
ncbi:hypothetical protein SALBM135S_07290 [Streptomyces alboniger]